MGYERAVFIETCLGLGAAGILARRLLEVGPDLAAMLLLGLILAWSSVSTRRLLEQELVGKDEPCSRPS